LAEKRAKNQARKKRLMKGMINVTKRKTLNEIRIVMAFRVRERYSLTENLRKLLEREVPVFLTSRGGCTTEHISVTDKFVLMSGKMPIIVKIRTTLSATRKYMTFLIHSISPMAIHAYPAPFYGDVFCASFEEGIRKELSEYLGIKSRNTELNFLGGKSKERKDTNETDEETRPEKIS